MTKQVLKISDYVLWIHLGVSEEERIKPQQVNLNIEINFLENLPACETDEIKNTVCYDELTTQIRFYVQEKQFKTIEYLAKKIYELTKQKIIQKNQTLIHIHKVAPPMPHILGGTHFIYGDA